METDVDQCKSLWDSGCWDKKWEELGGRMCVLEVQGLNLSSPVKISWGKRDIMPKSWIAGLTITDSIQRNAMTKVLREENGSWCSEGTQLRRWRVKRTWSIVTMTEHNLLCFLKIFKNVCCTCHKCPYSWRKRLAFQKAESGMKGRFHLVVCTFIPLSPFGKKAFFIVMADYLTIFLDGWLVTANVKRQ